MDHEQDAALEYVDEAAQAYGDAVARGEKQAHLRERQRTLTDAWVGAIEAGADLTDRGSGDHGHRVGP